MDFIISVLLPQLFHGLVLGGAVGLVAIGLSVIFGLMGVMNFAHGELYMWGAYVGFSALSLVNNFWVALVVAALFVAVIGAFVEFSVLRPLYRRGPFASLILTFGLAMVLREVVRMLWGRETLILKPPLPGGVSLLGMTYPSYRLLLLLFSVVILFSIWLLFMRTRAGIIVRAAVQDSEMLDGLGVNVPMVFTITFACGSALAAVAGLFLAPLFTIYPTMGAEMIMLAFIVVILGGMGSVGGSVLAALLVGEVQSILSLWMDPRMAAIIIFSLMILLLIFRPRGFFGKKGILE